MVELYSNSDAAVSCLRCKVAHVENLSAALLGENEQFMSAISCCHGSVRVQSDFGTTYSRGSKLTDAHVVSHRVKFPRLS